MTKINNMVKQIDEELCDAKEYAELCIESKSEGNGTYASKYKTMCEQELNHATYLHDMATEIIAKYRAIYTPPQEMLDIWDKSHKEYVEKVAWIKMMLQI